MLAIQPQVQYKLPEIKFKLPLTQFDNCEGTSSQMMDAVENKSNDLTVEFFIDQVKEGVWQGICKLKVDDCELAAVSVTDNLSNITKDLLKKIAIQLPVRYKLNQFSNLMKPSFLYQ